MPNNDVLAVQRGQEYYRIKQAIQSQGDIFEINESARAIYIGPDSDLAEVLLQYYDQSQASGLATAVVSVNGPFVGRVDSLPFEVIPSINQPGRLLVSPNDIVNPAYTAQTFTTAFRRFNVPINIDLIVALQELPAIPSVRSDRTLRFAQVPYDTKAHNSPTDDGGTDLVIPIYGRRLVTVQVVLPTAPAGAGSQASIWAVAVQPDGTGIPRRMGSVVTGAASPVVRQQRVMVYRASDAAKQGANYTSASPPVLNGFYNESDQPSDVTGINVGVAPRGMADMLIVNIKATQQTVSQSTLFADVYVKLADRET